MAIKILTAGEVPALSLTYVHFDQLNMTISRGDPARIAMTAKVSLYGVDAEGIKHFSPDTYNLVIRDMTTFITNLDLADQQSADIGMVQVQEGLGRLAEKYFGWQFEAVE